MIRSNSSYKMCDDDVFVFDGELVMSIDARVREPVFVAGNTSVYTRGELLAAYPFAVVGVQPEEVFAQQSVVATAGEHGTEYHIHDMGAEFKPLSELIAARRGAGAARVLSTFKTKVFMATDGWDDFMAVVTQLRAMMRFSGAAVNRANQTGQANMLTLMARGLVKNSEAPLALESAECRRAEADAREARLLALEARIDAKAAALAAMLDSM